MLTIQELINQDYKILNGEVTEDFDISKKNNKLVLTIYIKGDGWSCNYGNYDMIENCNCADLLSSLLDTFNISSFKELKGKAVRIAIKNTEDPVTIIGNIVYDKWFDFTDYINYSEERNITEEVINHTETVEDNVEEIEVIDIEEK